MAPPRTTTGRVGADRRRPALVLGVAIAAGVVVTLVLKGFEAVVDDGTELVWLDLFGTDEHRWRVVPLAAALGVALSAVLGALGQPRLVKPHLGGLELDEGGDATLRGLGVIVLVGLASLLAGASLGPEAPLVAFSAALGALAAQRVGLGPAGAVVQLACVGALLVAFLASFVVVALPLLILAQRKRLSLATAPPVVAASASAYATLWLVEGGEARGYGTIPVTGGLRAVDVVVATVLGVVAAGLGWVLKASIALLYRLASSIHDRVPWWAAGAAFGAVIGLLYWAGGPSVEFSGSAGTGLLLGHRPPYGVAVLALILVAKVLVTGWSLASGHRGGLVFPSVFVGVAASLLCLALVDGAGPGVMLGTVAGVLSALVGPVAALVFVVAMVPADLVVLAVVGILGAVVGNRLCARLPGVEAPAA